MINLKQETYKIYKSFKSIKSKAVGEEIFFNRYGWIHLSFTSSGHRRSAKDRRLRFHLLPFAKEIVIKSKTLVRTTEGSVVSKRGVIRKVKYFEIANSCDEDKKHITVIIRKIENGNAHFYSLRRTSAKNKKALAKQELN